MDRLVERDMAMLLDFLFFFALTTWNSLADFYL